MRHPCLVLITLLATAAPARAAPGLSEAAIRAFVARQETAWNREDLDGYFAGFSRDAVFVDQTRTPKGETIIYGRSTTATAKPQVRRYFAKSTFMDKGVIDRIVIAPGGATARVLGRKTTTVETAGRRQVLCAQTDQRLAWVGGKVVSRGQTDTTTRCQDAGTPAR